MFGCLWGEGLIIGEVPDRATNSHHQRRGQEVFPERTRAVPNVWSNQSPCRSCALDILKRPNHRARSKECDARASLADMRTAEMLLAEIDVLYV